MSGSSGSKDFKVGEIAVLVGLAIFIVVIIGMLGMWAWPKIEANWFAPPTPVADTRSLVMTNAEMNACAEPTERSLIPSASHAGVLMPAVQSLVKSGIISEPEPLLRRIIAMEALPFYMWSEAEGLVYGISDGPSSMTYVFTIYCSTEVEGSHYPLYDTVTITAGTQEEDLD